jgi:hypothetical protein
MLFCGYISYFQLGSTPTSWNQTKLGNIALFFNTRHVMIGRKRDKTTIRKRRDMYPPAALPDLEGDSSDDGNVALNGSQSLWPWGAPSPDPVLQRLILRNERRRELERGKIREQNFNPPPSQQSSGHSLKVPRFPHSLTARTNQYGRQKQTSGPRAGEREREREH